MDWKEVAFTGSDSAARVKKLQALCGCLPIGKCIDALLLIGGVDSFHSTLSQAALKFLFLGASGQELLGQQVISQQHERLEDTVLLLTARRIVIFYSSESDAAAKILPMISRWHNVQEITIHDAMDPDEQEMRKIRAFKDMVAGVERIGIPYGVDPRDPSRDLEDSMVPEKWPLIQSYGLDVQENGGKGSRGFFTMNHQIVNVSCALREVMAALDAFSAKRALQEAEPLLQYHFSQFLMKLDHAESPEARDVRSETEIGEDLLSFYEFGTMQYAARGLEPAPGRGSRVLFGKRTSNVALSSSSTVHLKDVGGASGFPATHMLVQVEDPLSGVRFARTYFLSTGKTCSRIVDEDALVQLPSRQLEQHDSDLSSTKDTRWLIELYVRLLRGFRMAHHCLMAYLADSEAKERGNGSLLLKRANAEAKAALIHVMLEDKKPRSQLANENKLSAEFLEENLELGVECLDARGLKTEFCAHDMNHLYVSLTLAVASQLNPTESLGSLVVGDSFLLKPVTTPSPSLGNGDAFVCVTKAFPYFRSWTQGGTEADSARAFVAALHSEFLLQSPALQLGQAVATMDALADAPSVVQADGEQDRDSQATAQIALTRATLLFNCEELPSVQGTMRLFTGGFVFLSSHMNPIPISFVKSVSSFQVVATSFDELVLLRVDLKPEPHTHSTPLSDVLPFSSAPREVFIPLLSGTRFQEEILRVLATWKRTTATLDIPFFRPSDLSLAFEGDTPRDGKASSNELPPVIRLVCAELVKKQSSASLESVKIVDSFLPKHFIPKESNPATALGKPNQDLRKMCIPITVMVGIPGSETALIAESVCEFSSGTNDWVHVKIDARDAPLTNHEAHYEDYTHSQIQLELCKSLEHIKANVNPLVHPRIMLSVVGYVDSITIASAVKSVALSASGPHAKLSSLTACVCAPNVYLPDPLQAQNPFPKLFDQMSSGLATHIIVTHSADISSSQLGRLRFHIDQVNPFADIQVLSQDVFEGPITALLALDRFESVYYVRHREARFPGWSSGSSWKQYVAELDNKLLPESLHFSIGPGMERSRFLHLVGMTLTPFALFSKNFEKMHQHQLGSQQQMKGIRMAQALAADKIREKLGARFTAATLGSEVSAASQMQPVATAEFGSSCWNVEARVTFASEPGVIYRYVSTGTSARLAKTHTRQDEEVKNKAFVSSLELRATGIGLDASKVRDMILHCYPQSERCVTPLRTKNMISLEEKREIQKMHAMDPLPEGYLYDGSHYVDFFGGRYEFHPNIAQFVEEHIAAANENAKQANAKAEESRYAQQTLVKQIV